MDKCHGVHPWREQDSAVNRNGAQTPTAPWTDREDMMLGTDADTQRHMVCNPSDRKHPEQANPETENGCVRPRVWGMERRTADRDGGLLWGDKNFPEPDTGDGQVTS